MQHSWSYSWPSLEFLTLDHTSIDGAAMQYLTQRQWPALRWLSLDGNDIDCSGILHLVQGSWSLLRKLALSDHSLDEEAYSLLGISEAPELRFMSSKRYRICKCSSDLPKSLKQSAMQQRRNVIGPSKGPRRRRKGIGF